MIIWWVRDREVVLERPLVDRDLRRCPAAQPDSGDGLLAAAGRLGQRLGHAIAPAGVGDLQHLGLLGGVGVVRAGVDLQLLDHLVAEAVLREHALDRAADGLLGPGGEDLAVGAGLEAAGVAGVVADQLGVDLAAR